MRFLIGPMASQPNKLGIKQLLNWSRVVDLADDWPSVLEAVTRGAVDPDERYDVLIAEFWLPGSLSFAEIHAADPTFSVIDVDLTRGTSNTPMFNVGSEKLRRLAEWLAKEAGLTSTAPEAAGLAEQVTPEVEEAEEAEQAATKAVAEVADPLPEMPAPKPPSKVPALEAAEKPPALKPPSRPRLVRAPPVPPRADADTQLADLARWLELRLGLMLAPAEAEVPRHDFPGWAMNAARARSLLGSEIAELPQAELLRQWQEVDARLDSYVEAAAHGPRDGSMGWICHAFDLDRVARQMLWIVAAPDIAGNLAQAIGFLNDDLGQHRPTLSLLAQMIDGAGPPWKLQRRLAGHDPFACFRLAAIARTDPLTPHSLAPLIAAPDLIAMLLGRQPGAAVEGVTLFDPADFGEEEFDRQLALVRWAAGRDQGTRPVVHFHAPAPEAGWLAGQLASMDEFALVGDIAPAAGADFAEVYDRLLAFGRAARVADAVLIVTGLDEHGEARRAELAQALAHDLAPHVKLLVVQGMRTAPTALRAAPGGVTEISRPRPTREERASIWTRAAAVRGLALSEDDARDMAATFAFDRTQAEAAIALALGSGVIEPPETSDEALRDSARIVSRASAPASVRRIETGLGWDDLILPAPIKAELESIVVQVKHGATVWEEWGFGERIPYGQAMIALLAGPSGTGKTMAAQIIAGELGAALFQVDLAKTVSKYIGETEKALDRIFEAAEAASAVLLFDEADALFGKRSDIHDAHDRYANIEVNFLLQRIEEHLAPVLLTTNRKANLDSAFLRRLNKVVDFPMPDEGQRDLIWKRMLPPEAWVAKDVDTSALRQLPFSGGGIANSVLAAAFMGASDGGLIKMRHLVAAARGELAKSGMESAGRTLTHLIDGARASGGEP